MSKNPQWATPERLELLRKLKSTECALGEKECPVITWWGDAISQALGGDPTEGEEAAWLLRAALVAPRILAKIPEYWRLHLPFYRKREFIADWKADDRDARKYANAITMRRVNFPDATGWGRQFDPIRRDAFMEQQAEMYIEAVGISGLTFTRIARVRVPSSPVRLFVDVAKAKKLSKNARRKWRRYGQVPREIPPTVEELCRAAVKDYQDKV